MIKQTKLIESKEISFKLSKPYSVGNYNKVNGDIQIIRLSEGCPNCCEYCGESKINGINPIYYPIPEIVKNNVQILDMNLIYKPKALDIIKELGLKRVNNKVVYYELVCGIDYRFMTLELAKALKESRFIKIRLAWDKSYFFNKDIKKCLDFLFNAGYKSEDIMVFIICNWKIPYKENIKKLDLLKIWCVKVGDCYFDNQVAPNIKPIYWNIDDIKDFRNRCRKHNYSDKL